MADTKNDFLKELKDEFKELGSKVSRMFEDLTGSGSENEFQLKVDVWENGDNYVFNADLPGLTKEEVKVQVLDNNLTISGERKVLSGIGEVKWHKKERSSGSFKRSFAIPAGINLEGIKAKFDNGVLTVTFPKEETAKSNTEIPIN